MMTYEEVFSGIDKRMSKRPALRLFEIAQQLGCSHPTIEKAILKSTSLTFRAYQKQMVAKKRARLLRLGHNAKEVAFELGYKWPSSFYRFLRKNAGCSITQIRRNMEDVS